VCDVGVELILLRHGLVPNSERLKTFLRPHADAGQVITEDLIKQFFTEEKDRKRVD